jgi:hypothetical protein
MTLYRICRRFARPKWEGTRFYRFARVSYAKSWKLRSFLAAQSPIATMSAGRGGVGLRFPGQMVVLAVKRRQEMSVSVIDHRRITPPLVGITCEKPPSTCGDHDDAGRNPDSKEAADVASSMLTLRRSDAVFGHKSPG